MNWKPGLSSCLLLTAGVAMAGCGAAADTATEVSTSAAKTPAAQQNAETAGATNATLVTLDLPGMTWMGCAASVRSDLKKYEEIEIVALNPTAATGKFQVQQGFDFKSVLAELSKTNSHIRGWSMGN